MGIKGNVEVIMGAFRRVRVCARKILSTLEECEFENDARVADAIVEILDYADLISKDLRSEDVQNQLDWDRISNNPFLSYSELDKLAKEADDILDEAMSIEVKVWYNKKKKEVSYGTRTD